MSECKHEWFNVEVDVPICKHCSIYSCEYEMEKLKAEVERLREELKKSACRYCPLKIQQEAKEARR